MSLNRLQRAINARGGSRLIERIAAQPVTRVTVSVDGVKLAGKPVAGGEEFELEWELPAAAVGKAAVEVAIETDRVLTPANEKRPASSRAAAGWTTSSRSAARARCRNRCGPCVCKAGSA